MTSILETQVTTLLTSELGRVPTSAEIANGLISPWTLAQTHNTLSAVTSTLTIGPTDNIQTALDNLHSNGGGSLLLTPGTYTLAANLTGYSSISLLGTSPTATILDFNSTAHKLAFAGTSVYTTGTITVASGVNITGSGTSWTGNVHPGQTLFLGTRSYVIAVVTDNTHLILAEAYGDSVTLPAAYRISTQATDINIANLSIKNATGTGLTFNDARRIVIDNVEFVTNNVGVSFTNCSEVAISTTGSFSSTSDGIQLTNVGFCNWDSVETAGNGGNGITASNVQSALFTGCASTGNTGDGLNLTTMVDATLTYDVEGNGGQGMEFVITCSGVNVTNSILRGNVAEGIKLTATATLNKFAGNSFIANGTYGINLANANDASNLIIGNIFASNSTAAASDSGTSTLIRSNIGLVDN